MQYTWFNSRSVVFTGENERVYTPGSQAGCASPDGSSAKSAQKLKKNE
jgi:hypothetical protein